MDNLISRSAFEKFIRDKYEDGESTDDIKDQMLFDLSCQPTVYEVDKLRVFGTEIELFRKGGI